MRSYSVSAPFAGVRHCRSAPLRAAFWAAARSSPQDQVPEQYKVFTAALSAVEDNYVGDVESDRLVYGAISGMLQTLDPHSSFIDPRSYAQMRERQEGRYYGLGITIQRRSTATSPSSACSKARRRYQKGIRRGDVIAKIEGEDAKGWTTEQAVRKLRGPKGTSVKIAITPRGYDELIDSTSCATRSTSRPCPPRSCSTRRPATSGCTTSARTPTDELGRALRDLHEEGHEAAGVRPARQSRRPARSGDQVVEPVPAASGDMIVYTRGRVPNSDQDYRATEQSDYLDMPMVTLVNRNSASASEIVSGALQDHDRSLIVGETTFGKALVQSVYRVSQGAGAGADDRALLHAERPADSAAVGRHLRRVPDLHAARAGRRTRRTSRRT